MSILRFSKMHALRNDFIVIESITQPVHLTSNQVQFLAHRHQGIGCDQLLLLEKSNQPQCDFLYRIFNQDGTEVAQCGNGARAIGLFIVLQQLSSNHHWRLQTKAGMMEVKYDNPQHIQASLGVPQFASHAIPIQADVKNDRYEINLEDGEKIEFFAVNVGNPHAIIFCEDLTHVQVAKLGHAIATHPIFPEQCNVSFVQGESSQCIKLRVYERGVGETQACGSAAVAAAAIVMKQFNHQENLPKLTNLIVKMPGGELTVRWPNLDQPIWLEGGATHVFNGEIAI